MNDQLTEYSEWIELGNHLTKVRSRRSPISLWIISLQLRIRSNFKKMAFKGETDEEFSSFVSAFRALATNPNLEEFAPRAIDLCGTGGDRTGVLIFRLLSQCWLRQQASVIKHGNRSISSKCGIADLLFWEFP